MFCNLDTVIFPDSCEVIEIVPSQLYVFPIFKNGSSSLNQARTTKKWKTITNEDISEIQTPITVFLRDPRDRFISGVNTYLQHLKKDHPTLDDTTIMWFVNQYLFLNRHYSPQFFWLINLAKYHPEVILQLENMDRILELTELSSRAEIIPPNEKFLEQIKDFDWHSLELYFYLDQIILNQIGQQITFQELLHTVKTKHSTLYDLIFKKSINITNALS